MEKALSNSSASAFLEQDIENITVFVNGSPQVDSTAVNFELHLVDVPLICWLGAATTQLISKGLTEFEAQLANGLIGKAGTSLSHQFLNISIAEAEAKVEPNTVADDFSRVAVVEIAHDAQYLTADPLNLIVPFWY